MFAASLNCQKFNSFFLRTFFIEVMETVLFQSFRRLVQLDVWFVLTSIVLFLPLSFFVDILYSSMIGYIVFLSYLSNHFQQNQVSNGTELESPERLKVEEIIFRKLYNT